MRYVKKYESFKQEDSTNEEFLGALYNAAKGALKNFLGNIAAPFKTLKDDFKKGMDREKVKQTMIAKMDALLKGATDGINKAEDEEALTNMRLDFVKQIDDQIAEVKEAQRLSQNRPTDNPQVKAMQETFVEWVDENGWYNQDEELHDYADSVGLRLRRKNPDWSYEKILKEVSSKTKEMFAEKFGIKKVAPPSPDSSGQGVRSANKGKLRESDLSSEERRAMDVFVKRIPGFTKEKYLEELQSVRL
jgi:hypothetical protein